MSAEAAEMLTHVTVEATQRSLAEWYAMGGWVMHGLSFCSAATVALAAERAFRLRRSTVLEPQAKPEGRLRSIDRLSQAAEQETEHPGAYERAVVIECGRLRRNLPLLAAVAQLATMLGLLGTVLGMTSAFDLIAQTGTGDARIVASGIFEALVTTAAGLSIAVVATAAHAMLRRRVESFEIELIERTQPGDEPAGEAAATPIRGGGAAAPSAAAAAPAEAP